jgi:hypothetical protein
VTADDLSAEVERLLGSRGAAVAPALGVLDALGSTDLYAVLTLLSARRAARLTAREAARHSRFHRPSPVDARLMHEVENVVLAHDDAEYVELSPLQPFGVNHALAGISQKNAVSALRQSEVNADATTALFTECLARGGADTTHLAAFCRSVRAQAFPAGSPLLPHFKVWARVSGGPHGSPYGHRELAALLDHLVVELTAIEKILAAMGRPGIRLVASVSNVLLSRQLAAAGVIDVPHHPATADGLARAAELGKAPREPSFAEASDPAWLRDHGFDQGVTVTGKFAAIVRDRHPELLGRLVFDLHRPYGVGYYKHLCFKVAAFLPDGTRIPLADGGSTTWADQALGHRRSFTVTSGVGTELLARHLLDHPAETAAEAGALGG